jgi:mannose-6-phosphate isomerase-like protein (cupin superfamily)
VKKINIGQKLALFSEHWCPKIVGELNGQYVKLAKIEGDFDWHHHENEDELFLVMRGRMCVQLRDREVWLDEGEMVIVPRAVEHRPIAPREAHILVFEPKSTLNTGTEHTARTVEKLDWI